MKLKSTCTFQFSQKFSNLISSKTNFNFIYILTSEINLIHFTIFFFECLLKNLFLHDLNFVFMEPKLIYILTFQFSGTTIDALTNLTKVAKQQNRCKEFKRNQSYSKPPTMGTILARTRQTLISYLTPCPLHPLPSSLALTTPFQPHPSKSAPFSHLPIISHHHHQ